MIERRLENLLALDYPAERLEIVVASDASTDRTNELVEAVAAREPRVRLLDCPRGGKVAAQDRAVRETTERGRRVLRRERDLGARRAAQLVANLADPEVAYVCGQLRLETADGTNREGALLALRDVAARAGVAARLDHRRQRLDLRASSAATTSRSTRAAATTSRSRTGWCRRAGAPSTSRRRSRSRSRRRRTRPSTGARCGCSSTAGRSRCAARCSGGCRPATSSRSSRTALLRYGSGILHLALLVSSVALVADGWAYGVVLAGQVALLAAAAARRADRALLRARHVGDRRGALELPAPRRARDLGGGGGDAVNRVARRRRRRRSGSSSRARSSAAAALAIKLEDGGPVLYRQTRVGKDGVDFELLKLRTMVVGAETKGAGLRGRRGRPAHHARRADPAADVDRRAAAALERPARRHEPDRAATDAPLPGRARTRSASAGGSTSGRA